MVPRWGGEVGVAAGALAAAVILYALLPSQVPGSIIQVGKGTLAMSRIGERILYMSGEEFEKYWPQEEREVEQLIQKLQAK